MQPAIPALEVGVQKSNQGLRTQVHRGASEMNAVRGAKETIMRGRALDSQHSNGRSLIFSTSEFETCFQLTQTNEFETMFTVI